MQKEFTLQSTQNPANPKFKYFNSLFFYEPLLTDQSFDHIQTRNSFAHIQYTHPFKYYFPKKNIYYFPKIIVIQSEKPIFYIQLKLLTLLFKIVYQPYIRGQAPFKMQPKMLNVFQFSEPKSIIAEKEFVLSYLFSFRLPKMNKFEIQVHLNSVKMQMKGYSDFSTILNEDLHEFFEEILSNETKLKKLISIFHCVILERQIYVIHPRPGLLYNLISAIIFP